MVLAIISILAALLLPSLRKARDQATAVRCLNNIKQVNLAVQIYRNDWSDRVPVESVANDFDFWMLLTNRYLPTQLYCPLEKSPSNHSGGTWWCYAINNNIQQYYNKLNWNQNKLPPARVVLIGECYWYYFNSAYNFNNTMYGLGGAGFTQKQVHNNGLNFVFADSHAELVRPGAGRDWSTTPWPCDDVFAPDGKGLFYDARPNTAYND